MKVYTISIMNQDHYHSNCLPKGTKITFRDENDIEQQTNSEYQIASLILSSATNRIISCEGNISMAYFMEAKDSPLEIKTICILEKFSEYEAARKANKAISIIENLGQTQNVLMEVDEDEALVVFKDLFPSPEVQMARQQQEAINKQASKLSTRWYKAMSQWSCLSCFFLREPLDDKMTGLLEDGDHANRNGYDSIDESDYHSTSEMSDFGSTTKRKKNRSSKFGATEERRKSGSSHSDDAEEGEKSRSSKAKTIASRGADRPWY